MREKDKCVRVWERERDKEWDWLWTEDPLYTSRECTARMTTETEHITLECSAVGLLELAAWTLLSWLSNGRANDRQPYVAPHSRHWARSQGQSNDKGTGRRLTVYLEVLSSRNEISPSWKRARAESHSTAMRMSNEEPLKPEQLHLTWAKIEELTATQTAESREMFSVPLLK